MKSDRRARDVAGGHDRFAEARARMVAEQLRPRGITDARVLSAMEAVPRHCFVPARLREDAYGDHPLPIGFGQAISQPFIVALMTQLLVLEEGGAVLEVGTGCGYQTAILAAMGANVDSIEIVPELAKMARLALRGLSLRGRVRNHIGDGWNGLPEGAPFGRILVTAAPMQVSEAWTEQLAEGGRLVVPLGPRDDQSIHCFTKRDGRLQDQPGIPVRFVPLVRSMS